MKIGSIIRDIRKKKGIKQMHLSEQIGITQAYLSQIERDKKEPNVSVLNKIADALSVPLPIIFFLSLGAEDVPESKRAAYKIVEPSIKAFINEFFTN